MVHCGKMRHLRASITLLRAQEGQLGCPDLVVQRFHRSLDGREKCVANLVIELYAVLFRNDGWETTSR